MIQYLVFYDSLSRQLVIPLQSLFILNSLLDEFYLLIAYFFIFHLLSLFIFLFSQGLICTEAAGTRQLPTEDTYVQIWQFSIQKKSRSRKVAPET